ncbi:MAG: porin family protein [Muribaculaceae bacterium]
MKKVLFALISVLAVTFTAQAQLGFGAKGGLNLTNFIGESAPHDLLTKYHVGMFLEYKVMPKFAIAPEVMFSAQGGSEKLTNHQTDDIVYTSAETKSTTNYISVPVMFKIYPVSKFSIDFGPQFGFNVYSKVQTTTKETEFEQQDNKNSTKTFELSFGAGFTYYMTKHIFLQARYSVGITKAFDDVLGDMKNTARNGVGQLSIGFKL